MDQTPFLNGYFNKEAVIKQEDGEWVLYTRDESRVLGRHPTKAKALAQERKIQIEKHKRREKNKSAT